jgi:prevent-host-death family protein
MLWPDVKHDVRNLVHIRASMLSLRDSGLTTVYMMYIMVMRCLMHTCHPVGGLSHADEPRGEPAMMRLNVVTLRQSLADIINRAAYQGERIVIHRHGKDAAAIISIEDLKLLERLIEDAEDRLDVMAAQEALAESAEQIPYAGVRKRLGLDDEQKAKRPGAKARATKV